MTIWRAWKITLRPSSEPDVWERIEARLKVSLFNMVLACVFSVVALIIRIVKG